MTMLGAGGLIAAIGLVPLARSVQQVTDRRILGFVVYGAATLAIGGAVSWVIISYVRIARSPFEVVFVDASPWLFGTYRVFTRSAVIVLGVVLLLSGYPRWLGWTLILAAVLGGRSVRHGSGGLGRRRTARAGHVLSWHRVAPSAGKDAEGDST
jgi:hypothetical protein